MTNTFQAWTRDLSSRPGWHSKLQERIIGQLKRKKYKLLFSIWPLYSLVLLHLAWPKHILNSKWFFFYKKLNRFSLITATKHLFSPSNSSTLNWMFHSIISLPLFQPLHEKVWLVSGLFSWLASVGLIGLWLAEWTQQDSSSCFQAVSC